MNVLIVGLGSIGIKHIAEIRKIEPKAKIFALRSGGYLENQLDVTNIYDLNKLDTLAIDFAIISNPTSLHLITISQLINFEFPLFIEKPIHNSLDIGDLANLIHDKGIITYVACNLRFLDCINFVKNYLYEQNNKKLNEVNVYCGSYLGNWRPDIDFRQTYSAKTELGGGVHLDLIHELDYLFWLFGAPKEVKRSFRSKSSLNISSFDYANYLLDYGDFCACTILNYYRKDSKRTIELVFENETWYVDLLKNQISCNNNLIFTSDQRIADTYQLQMKSFINSIKEKKNTFNTFSHAYEVLKICLNQ